KAARLEQVDHRADLYAWGVVAYELLAGRHAFGDGMSPDELVAAHIGETPRPLAEVAHAVPLGLAEIVARCMAKRPEARPGSGAEIIAAIETAAIAPAPRPGSARRVRLRTIAAVGLVALLGAGVPSTWWWSAHHSQQQGVAAIVVTGTGDPAIDV